MSGPVSNLNPRIRLSWTDPRFIIMVMGLIALAVLPIFADVANNTFMVSFFSKVMIFAIAAASLDLILGYGGMVSFGHAAYIGLGAYAVAVWSKYGVDYEIAWMQSGYVHFATAVVGSAIIALAIGAISLRTSGVYFIMITLAFTQMLYFLGISLEPFGGDDGMGTDRSEFWLFNLRDSVFREPSGASDNSVIYYVCLIALVVATFLLRRIVNSRFGMVIRGSFSNPVRMQAIGFPSYRYRLTGFVIAGAICGVAGALFANLQQYLTPDYMLWIRSGDILIMVIMGGMGTIFGSVFGAVSFLALEEFLQGLVGRDYWMLVFGPLLILLVLFAKRGIFGLIPDRTHTYPAFHLKMNVVLAAAALVVWHLAVFPSTGIILVLIAILLVAKVAAQVQDKTGPPLFYASAGAFVVACMVMAVASDIPVARAAPPLVADAAAMLIYAFRRAQRTMAGLFGLVCLVALVGASWLTLPLTIAVPLVAAGVVVSVGLVYALKSVVAGVLTGGGLHVLASVIAVVLTGVPLLPAIGCILAILYVWFTILMALVAAGDGLPPVVARLGRPQHA